ncbi:helix-turn-helix transcriptional regulator [Nocardioides marmotae]|uniref:WYL domain-containing protein n=1 Tax=Nocardioides marmotae TaxID=2663857 RepID=A0A6I3J5G5_9ACTN|nr:WYL domain-containing protein [Nocardioides marmotae]MCR6030857.1 WYL domain-containing protein [Gordonia jinghuaiqii]MBC9733878.1 WYL domain-containing protein [Nocardioides marmotae]MTB84981.1 WYL domain-containing protein [Nocardioides marmotae]MTB94494.1 WYL domain-containing protein [Nocardioides marmotae]QKE01486.1 WYL domain-containing protein [Nocardioides marmotae]
MSARRAPRGGQPTSGAKDQVARLLALVPYLHAHGQVRVDDAAAALGVRPEQVVKDLKVLLMVGLPGGYPDDLIDVDLDSLEGPEADGVIRISNADYLARPLRLTPTEATAIIVALRALRGGAGEETRSIVDRALAKLEAAAAEAVPRVDPGLDAADVDLALRATRLQQAAADRRQVRMTYWVPSRDEQTERVVDPRGVVHHHGWSYLDAWDHGAEAPRLFRLDRIQGLEVLDRPIETEPTAPRDLGEGIFSQSEETRRVTLHLDPPARWVTEYYAMEEVRPRDDGTLEVDLVVADERWLLRLLLRLAPHARVVVPPEFTEPFVAAVQDALNLYRNPA